MFKRYITWLGAPTLCLALAACSSVSLVRAPVVDVTSITKTLPPGYENAGKPGYYTVKPGDTLVHIGLEYGQGSKDIARWNGISNPNVIVVGQVVRVVPPASAPSVTTPTAPFDKTSTPAVQAQPINNASPLIHGSPLQSPRQSASGPVTSRPIPAATALPQTPKNLGANVVATPATAPTNTTNASANTAASSTGQSESRPIQWAWPIKDPVSESFNDNNKGFNFSGQSGDPIYAAANGIVVYAGNGLRGYGNLIILKHNDQFLTAYAHNQSLMVKEDQVVQRGQQIATMGNTDASSPMLHFEIRKDGKPVDPTQYLPKR